MNKRERFLERVEQQLYTEDAASLICDELDDHIQCLIEDYEAAGYSPEHSESKALLQMGDPTEIGYSFTDYDGMRKRKYMMFALKLSAMISLMMTLGIGILHAGLPGKEDFTSMVPPLFNFLYLWFVFASGMVFLGHSMKFLEMDLSPYIIIWPVRGKFQFEYLILTVFFLPIVGLTFFVYFAEMGMSSMSFMKLWPMITVGYGVFAYFYAEKFRIPKYLVVKEGFIIKGRLISWVGIQNYTWSKDFQSGEAEHYRLVLNCYGHSRIPVRKTIKVHNRQHHALRSIIRRQI